AGERFQITMAFTTRLPQAKNWGYYHGLVALDGRWYPMLVPWRQGAWVWGMQEFVHATYTLRLTAAADQQVVASVPWTSSTQQDGQQTLAGSAGPLYQLGLSLGVLRQSTEEPTRDHLLRAVSSPGDAPEARHLLHALREVLAFYHQEFALSLRSSAS